MVKNHEGDITVFLKDEVSFLVSVGNLSLAQAAFTFAARAKLSLL